MHRTFSTWMLAALCAVAGVAGAARVERGNLLLDGMEAPGTELRDRAARALGGRDAVFAGWLPGGALAVITRFGEVGQLHRVAQPLGAREQLTFGNDPLTAGAIARVAAPVGAATLRDDALGRPQVWYQRFADSAQRRLTDGKSLHGAPLWSNDGKRLVFWGTGRDNFSHDIYLVEPETIVPPRLIIAAVGKSWTPLDWSPDDRRLLLLHAAGRNATELHIADIATGSVTPLPLSRLADGSAAQPPYRIAAARFAPDGRGVHLISALGGEFAQLHYVDATTGDVRTESAGGDGDVESFATTRDGRFLAYVTHVDGASRLTVRDQIARSELAIPALPAGAQLTTPEFDVEGKRLALTIATAQDPRDVHVLELERNALVRYTRSERGPRVAAEVVVPALVRYPTWDRVNGRQRAIAAYLYKPRAAGPHPVVMLLEGAAGAQHRPVFDPTVQFLVNELGYAVVAPNVRGAAGYGATFAALADGAKREDALRDVASLLVWIGVQRDLDRSNVTVMGRGPGAALALASLSLYSDRLRAGIEFAGSPGRANLRAIRRPLFVIQGLNDRRVPASESEAVVASVRGSSGEAWYLAAKDESHVLRRQSNVEFTHAAIAAFLARFSAP